MSQCQKVSCMTVHHRLHRNGWNCLVTMVHPNRKQRRPFSTITAAAEFRNTSSCVTAVVVTSNQLSCLEFWAQHANSLPRLHEIALKALPVPVQATSAPVERVFSSGGMFMRPHRARLSNRMLSDLVFLKCNNDKLSWTVLLNTGTEGLLSLNQKPIKLCNI